MSDRRKHVHPFCGCQGTVDGSRPGTSIFCLLGKLALLVRMEQLWRQRSHPERRNLLDRRDIIVITK